jgi:hypothetical protein
VILLEFNLVAVVEAGYADRLVGQGADEPAVLDRDGTDLRQWRAWITAVLIFR